MHSLDSDPPFSESGVKFLIVKLKKLRTIAYALPPPKKKNPQYTPPSGLSHF